MLAEGRRPDAKGLTLLETSKIIHYAGAYEAINLDGGGSSSLIIDGELVSKRPTKEPTIRPVSNSIMVIQE
jgi:exopolysaccharide biosynthesis protein